MKPVSFSELTLYEQDQEKWYRRYILGIEDPPTHAMKRGSDIHAFIAGTSQEAISPKQYLPGERRIHDRIKDQVKKQLDPNVVHEKRVEVSLCRIPTVGVWDYYLPRYIGELKTQGSHTPTIWLPYLDQLAWYALQHVALHKTVPVAHLFIASTKNARCKDILLQGSDLADRMELNKERLKQFWKQIKSYRTKRVNNRL